MTKSNLRAAYLELLESGEFIHRVKAAYSRLSVCDICANECGVDRLSGEQGVCRTGDRAIISSYGPHHGEEDPLRGYRGSGTIFFNRCNLGCQYCQNHDISQGVGGHQVDPEDLAAIMLELQDHGCHNINFVSPSHIVPQILASVLIASQAGLKIPLVYNTGGYDALSSLHLLEGVIDIYMPDMKYADALIAKRFSKIDNYPQVNQTIVSEMHQQVGDLELNNRGIAVRGLLVRHLVLPGNLAGTDQIVQFLASKISTNTYLNLMDQYRPSYRARDFPELNRPVTQEEYKAAVHQAKSAGLTRLDQRRSTRFWSR